MIEFLALYVVEWSDNSVENIALIVSIVIPCEPDEFRQAFLFALDKEAKSRGKSIQKAKFMNLYRLESVSETNTAWLS